MNSTLTNYVERLADGLCPLNEWINSKSYIPPNASWLPWRQGGTTSLRSSNLRFVEFLHGLINESSSDEEQKVRYASKHENPLAQSPFDDAASWRALRNLSPSPSFGILESDNMVTDVDGHPMSRSVFYRTYLPLFEDAATKAVTAAGTLGLDWKAFAAKLWNNESDFWPKSLPRKSSTFVKQLGKDFLYCALGMRNSVPIEWRDAVLVELGEFRRVGNQFSEKDAAEAVKQFRAVFDPIFSGGPTAPPGTLIEAVEPFMFAPIGAPPVTTREQQV